MASPPFDMQLIHWPNVAAFTAYLAAIPRPSWCQGLTNHNTYRPNELQWRGVASMNSMRKTYIAKGWTSGPHLYCVAACPNPADSGIWQMTPITHQGTHAGPCNRDHLGIEHCGDFNAHPPTWAQYDLLLSVNRAILARWGLLATDVNVHNECMQNRTCPGQYLTGEEIRADLAPSPPPKHYTVAGLPVYERSDHTGPLWGYLMPGQHVTIDDPNNGHVSQLNGVDAGIGFVDMAGLTLVEGQ